MPTVSCCSSGTQSREIRRAPSSPRLASSPSSRAEAPPAPLALPLPRERATVLALAAAPSPHLLHHPPLHMIQPFRQRPLDALDVPQRHRRIETRARLPRRPQGTAVSLSP